MESNLVPELRDFLITSRDRLLQQNNTRHAGPEWMTEYSSLLDETLQRIYHAAWREVHKSSRQTVFDGLHGSDGSGLPYSESEGALALLAIGGYGRGELCPYSDIDIAFVPLEEEHPVIDAVIKEAFRLIVEVLIDGAKLDVGYAYRPIGDCARLDHTGKAALLEARYIAGSEHVEQKLRTELNRTWDGVEFLLDKASERRSVSRRPEMSLYSVEPNLKEGAGGLRDIQTAQWIAGAILETESPLRELQWRGIVTAHDVEELLEAHVFLYRIRIWLHLATGRKTDVLRVDWQDRCARAFDYTGAGPLASQGLLRDYYRHAECAHAFLDKVMRRLLEGPLTLDAHFVAEQKRLRAAHPYTLHNHPELIVTPFVLSRKYGFAFTPGLDRGIEGALTQLDDEARHHSIVRASLLSLLHDVETAGESLHELRERGVLQAIIPEFRQMMHLAPSDPSHQFTVGEHSLFAVRELSKLWQQRTENDEMFGVWSGVSDPEVLILATLLHDCGKIFPHTRHSESGATLAAEIAGRFKLRQERCENVEKLVRQHLLLPRVARLHDLASPGTIREVVEEAGSVEMLKMLYLLALADTKTVGDKTYTQLDLERMRELYERAVLAMTQEETAQALTDNEVREQIAQRERERIRREMRRRDLDDETLERISENLPAAYVLNTPLATVATHMQFLEQLPGEDPIVDFYDDPRRTFTEMTVVTYDDPQPGLLSRLCGVLYAANLEIMEASVFTLRARDAHPKSATPSTEVSPDIALDRLYIAANGRVLSESQRAKIAALLREVLTGEKSVEEILRGVGKPATVSITPERIAARNDLSDEHTVVTLVLESAPGMLYHVTRAFAAVGLDIHTAKISTWAGRAEDAFYVTRRRPPAEARYIHGDKLADDEIKSTLEALSEKLRRPEG